jgi:hypothetical protein
MWRWRVCYPKIRDFFLVVPPCCLTFWLTLLPVLRRVYRVRLSCICVLCSIVCGVRRIAYSPYY